MFETYLYHKIANFHFELAEAQEMLVNQVLINHCQFLYDKQAHQEFLLDRRGFPQ